MKQVVLKILCLIVSDACFIAVFAGDRVFSSIGMSSRIGLPLIGIIALVSLLALFAALDRDDPEKQ